MGDWKLVYDFGNRAPIPPFYFFIALILTVVGLGVYYHNKSAVSSNAGKIFEINTSMIIKYHN